MPVAQLKQNVLFQRAEKLLKTFKEYKELEAVINKDKEFFRTKANGETLTEVVPGLGSVTVRKPAAAGSGTSLVFDEEKFKALDAKTKSKLETLGVVVTREWSSPEGTAAVAVMLNK